jgi:hypothetical protein
MSLRAPSRCEVPVLFWEAERRVLSEERSRSVGELDVSEYKGRIGDPIFIRAHDDVGVVTVNVKLTKAEGTPIESGQAVQRSGDTWVYMATVAIPLGTHLFISADAFDRPGHRAVTTVNPLVGESS